MFSEALANVYKKTKPYLLMILLKFGFAGMSIISKFALNKGMSPYVLVVYRHAIATIVIAPFAICLERKVRPKITISVFLKIALLGLLEPVLDQNLFYIGMKYTTATFTAAMCNILPAFAFLMAWICRLEKVNIRRLHSQAKIVGTIATVGGAMVMCLVKGPMIDLPWTKAYNHESTSSSISSSPKQDPIKGSLMITAGVFCMSAFIIVQAFTLKAYPAELSLTALICLMGTIEGTIAALVFERGNSSAWSIHMDSKFLAAAYNGIICSAVSYYLQGMVIKAKGPVFVTAFNPLGMIIVAILSSFILSEIMYLGRVIGAVVIVVGLYVVLWGKSKDQCKPKVEENDNKAIQSDDHNHQQMTASTMTNERIVNSNQDFVTLEVSK